MFEANCRSRKVVPHWTTEYLSTVGCLGAKFLAASRLGCSFRPEAPEPEPPKPASPAQAQPQPAVGASVRVDTEGNGAPTGPRRTLSPPDVKKERALACLR